MLGQISIANGWRTDAGTDVTLEDDYALSALAANKAVMFIGCDSVQFDGQTSKSLREVTMTINVELSLPIRQGNAQQTAHNGIQDIVDVFPTSSEFLPIGAGKSVIQSAQVIRRPEGLDVIVAQVTAGVGLTLQKPIP